MTSQIARCALRHCSTLIAFATASADWEYSADAFVNSAWEVHSGPVVVLGFHMPRERRT